MGTTWRTPCAGECSGSKRGVVMSGNLERSSWKLDDIWETAAAEVEDVDLLSIVLPPGRRRQLFLTSINNECFLKKSAPRMGLSTLATRNEWRAEKLGRSKRMDFLPKVSMKVPFAARNLWPRLGERSLLDLLADKKDVGKTDMSAPLSIKKEHFEVESNTLILKCLC